MAIALLLATSVQAGDRPPAALITIDGPTTALVGDEFTVEVNIDAGGADVYGVSLDMTFDGIYLEVLDDDGGVAGVQITPGDCPQPDFVVENAADNGLGTIDYAATQLNPTPPCESGTVATLRLRALSGGSTTVGFTDWLVSDPNGIAISTSAVGLEIEIGGAPVDQMTWTTVKALYR